MCGLQFPDFPREHCSGLSALDKKQWKNIFFLLWDCEGNRCGVSFQMNFLSKAFKNLKSLATTVSMLRLQYPCLIFILRCPSAAGMDIYGMFKTLHKTFTMK